jgi:polyphosphate kinase
MHNNTYNIPGGPYIDRDISWLFFNERVLAEAASPKVPLLERMKFLSIYSSNLDEFYRVRMPALKALDQIGNNGNNTLRETADTMIRQQLDLFGRILREELIPLFREQGIAFLYGQAPPEALKPVLRD